MLDSFLFLLNFLDVFFPGLSTQGELDTFSHFYISSSLAWLLFAFFFLPNNVERKKRKQEKHITVRRVKWAKQGWRTFANKSAIGVGLCLVCL